MTKVLRLFFVLCLTPIILKPGIDANFISGNDAIDTCQCYKTDGKRRERSPHLLYMCYI